MGTKFARYYFSMPALIAAIIAYIAIAWLHFTWHGRAY
jgi:hypothetical protein